MRPRDKAILAAVVDLRARVNDVDALVDDMLRPARARELGPITHRDLYDEARGSIADALTHIAELVTTPDDDGGDHGDPSGNGGAGPTH